MGVLVGEKRLEGAAVTVVEGQYWLHRRRPWLVLVYYTDRHVVGTTRVTFDGGKNPGTRRYVPLRRAIFERTYRLYRPCRWDLECTVQATGTAHHSTLGDYDACAGHLTDHLTWSTLYGGLPAAHRPSEPSPACTNPGRRDCVQASCPVHGTLPGRGHTFGSRLGPNLAAFHAADGHGW